MTALDDCVGAAEILAKLGSPPNFADGFVRSTTMLRDERESSIELVIQFQSGLVERGVFETTIQMSDLKSVALSDLDIYPVIERLDFAFGEGVVVLTISAISGIEGRIAATTLAFVQTT